MGIGDMLQAERDAEDAKRYRWLKSHPDTTPNLWRLLAKGGPENSSESFDKMVDRIMASEAAAFERGRQSTSGAEHGK
jgi:hypothetical protein